MPTYDARPANPQPGDRCPRCDRERCVDDNATDCQGKCHFDYNHDGDDYECEAHAVDWRTRALAAEAKSAKYAEIIAEHTVPLEQHEEVEARVAALEAALRFIADDPVEPNASAALMRATLAAQKALAGAKEPGDGR